MKEDKKISKSVIVVSLTLAFVLILVIALFILGQRERSQNKIQLPDAHSEISDSTPVDTEGDNNLLSVDNQNVIDILTSMNRADFYHQLYSVEVGNGIDTAASTVELWVCEQFKQAQVTTSRNTKTVVSDGENIWIWYVSDHGYTNFLLTEDLTFEDVLGLPAFDYLNVLETAHITEAEYLILEEGNSETACIFLAAQQEEDADVRYWISLETGLLYEADAMNNSTQVYHVQQTAFDLLASEDEVFSDKFILPDGTSIIE